jgi:predicted negative regulator of RcsB-dependent stress response
MTAEKISRKELLKTEDEFITFSSQMIILAKEHQRELKFIGVGLVCLILIYLGINTYLRYINNKAQDAYNIAYYAISKNMDSKADQDSIKKSGELFNDVGKKYGISKAARLVLPELAYVNFLQQKYDEAISKYQEFLAKAPEDPYKSLAETAIAVCYEEKGDLDKALQILEKISSGPNDFFKEQAMLSTARIYRAKDQKEKSNEILNRFIKDFPDSQFLPLAKANIKP